MLKKETDSQAYVKKRLVAAARAIVTYQVGLPVGSLRIHSLISRGNDLGLKLSYPVFFRLF